MITSFIRDFLIHPAPIDCFSDFLIHPVPIDYSGNTCSYDCVYCFTNNRGSNWLSNNQLAINLLKKYPQSGSYAAALIREGYPFCFSKNSDPFSRKNIKRTLSALRYLNNMPNGIFFHTKGGERLYEALEIIRDKKNVVFCITITTLNDELSKISEPGAPVPSERVKLAYDMKKRGYEIIIAINPYVKEWLSEQELVEFAKENKKHGITHYILSSLILEKGYHRALTVLGRLPEGKTTIENGLSHNKKPYIEQLYAQKIVMRLINELKVNAAWMGMPYNTDFYTAINTKLGKHFPSLFQFANYCVDNDLDIVTYNDYKTAMEAGNESFFDKAFAEMPEYIFRLNRRLWKDNREVQGVKSINDVLKVFWNEKRLSLSPQNNFVMFDTLKTLDKDGNMILKRKKRLAKPDENGSFANCGLPRNHSGHSILF